MDKELHKLYTISEAGLKLGVTKRVNNFIDTAARRNVTRNLFRNKKKTIFHDALALRKKKLLKKKRQQVLADKRKRLETQLKQLLRKHRG